MRLTSFLRIAALVVLGALAAFSTLAQDTPIEDPMAAAARKTRAEHKDAPKPKKIFTNDDIPSAPASKPADAKAAGGQNDSPAGDDKTTATENDPKSEIYWRRRFSKTRAKLAQSEQELDVLQRELNKNEVQYYSDPQKAMTQQYSRKDINDNLAKLDAKKAEVAALKQQLSDMEDELRKAGGDPGWAR